MSLKPAVKVGPGSSSSGSAHSHAGTLTREVVQQPEALRYDEGVLLEVALHDYEQGHKQALVLNLGFASCLLCKQVAETPQHRAGEL